jgi:hypothetical protein
VSGQRRRDANTYIVSLRTARAFIPHHPFPCQPLSRPASTNSNSSSTSALQPCEACRQGDISRFLCVCAVSLNLHIHFPCDAAPLYLHSSQLLIDFSSVVPASLHCKLHAASASRERAGKTSLSTVNKRHAALLRLPSAASTLSDITLRFAS